MNKNKENEKKEEKWKPAHEAAAEILEETVDSTEALTIVKMYGEKNVKVPLKGIPRLREVFKKHQGISADGDRLIVLALANLKQQEKEEKVKEKEKMEFKVRTTSKH